MLEVRQLSLAVPSPQGPVAAVSDVSFTLRPGRVLSLVGESGCGKTLTAQAILRLGEHQGINLPGAVLSAPSLTRKDRADLAFGLRAGVDAVAD